MSDPTSRQEPAEKYGKRIEDSAKDYVTDKVSVVGDKISVAEYASYAEREAREYARTMERLLVKTSYRYISALLQMLIGRTLLVFFVAFFGVKFVFDQYWNRVLTVSVVTTFYLMLELVEFRLKRWRSLRG